MTERSLSVSHDLHSRIQADVTDNAVVLYMKGTPAAPACGFSSLICQILLKLNIPFVSRNVLEDLELRQGIKDFTNWPTIPQLYIHGEFVGGCDIVKDMYASGELQALFAKK